MTTSGAASRPSTRRSAKRPRSWPATASTRWRSKSSPIPTTHEDPFVRSELVLELARASGPSGMAGGQMMDLAAEGQSLDLAAITRLQQLKTGALIEYAVEAAVHHGAAAAPRRARPIAAMPATSASPSRSPTT